MHEKILRTWPQAFQAVWDNLKAYEIRNNDRDFAVGDCLVLEEWDPDTEKYSGRRITCRVTYMTEGGDWGLPGHMCVMSIRQISRFSDGVATVYG